MDIKFYVSYEAARLLKEKGYDGDAEYAYHENGNFSHWGRNVNDIDYLYAAPTKAEAIDWLESKGIYISIYYKKEMYDYFVEHKTEYFRNEVCGSRETRLEAEDAAIIKALELL